MPPQGTRSWWHPFALWQRSSSPTSTYVSVPTDEDGEGLEKRTIPRPTTGVRSPPLSSKSSARWLSKHFILFRILPSLLIPTLIVLLVVLGRRPIIDTIKNVAHSGLAGHDSAVDRTTAEPLRPAKFDPSQPYRKALVLASYSAQNVEWLTEISAEWEVYRYVLDNPNPISGLTVPRNQGREAMAYLTYIIDHYDNLPEFIIFHHGHRRAWHQPEPTPMKLRALNLSSLAHDHYINLRCAHLPGCTADTYIDLVHVDPKDLRQQAHMLPRFWNTMFGQESVWDLGPKPSNVSVTCCAQFAVTREAIRRRPLAFWVNYRRPLERDLEEYVPIWGPQTNSYSIGICYEKLWHMVFGKPAIHCPKEDYCRRNQFSDSIVCDRYTGAFEDSQGWENIKCIEKWQDD